MKNKKVIIVTAAVVAAAAVISGIVLFLATPFFGGRGQQESEKKQQNKQVYYKEILKTAGSDFKGRFSDIMSVSAAAPQSKQLSPEDVLSQMAKLEGWIDIEEAAIGGKDYTEGGTLHYELSDLLNDINSSENEIISAAEKNGQSLADVDEETIKRYQKIVEKLSGYMVNAAEEVVDGSTYEKQQETVQLSLGDETITAEAHKVIIPVPVIISSAENAIDNIFNDADIAPYITMLNAAGLKLDRDEMKKTLREKLDMESIYFTMYVKDDTLCGLYMDGTWYDEASESKAEYLFWNDKFGFNIDATDYEGNSFKFKCNGKLEPNV